MNATPPTDAATAGGDEARKALIQLVLPIWREEISVNKGVDAILAAGWTPPAAKPDTGQAGGVFSEPDWALIDSFMAKHAETTTYTAWVRFWLAAKGVSPSPLPPPSGDRGADGVEHAGAAIEAEMLLQHDGESDAQWLARLREHFAAGRSTASAPLVDEGALRLREALHRIQFVARDIDEAAIIAREALAAIPTAGAKPGAEGAS